MVLTEKIKQELFHGFNMQSKYFDINFVQIAIKINKTRIIVNLENRKEGLTAIIYDLVGYQPFWKEYKDFDMEKPSEEVLTLIGGKKIEKKIRNIKELYKMIEKYDIK